MLEIYAGSILSGLMHGVRLERYDVALTQHADDLLLVPGDGQVANILFEHDSKIPCLFKIIKKSYTRVINRIFKLPTITEL